MKILVIDDEVFALKLLVHQLEGLGYARIIQCQRAHDALVSLREADEPVGLIFCDLQMPEMDGVEFVRQLVGIGYAGALVLISGEDERILQAAEKLARAHKLDVLGSLRKPVFPEDLQEVLASNLLRPAMSSGRLAARRYEAQELAHAIADGQLVNHFQPKVSVACGSVVGMEVLVRWRHPRDGLVYPDQFVPLAEQAGLIDELTRAVLTASLRQMGHWRDVGLDLHVAVNVSMDNLRALEFPDFVLRAAREARAPMQSIVLEVTESQAMSDPLTTLDILTRLRLKRIGLAIDDFGTGHSSLAQLRDLPFEELKLDRGFVHGACRDTRLQAIVEATLGMGRQMGMKIVAEGVEDRDDWNYLRTSGCDFAQGYFIAKPMPAEQIAGWIADWSERRETLLAFHP